MRGKSALKAAALGLFGALVLTSALHAQGAGGPGAPWRGAGAQPCYGPDGGAFQCPPAPQVLAVRASRLLDTKTGQIAVRQVVLIQGERITEVGPEAQVKIPAGAQVIDLGPATVLPGLIDAHTHMFNPPKPGMSRETSTLIAIHNLQADLRAGFTTARDMSSHGNGYGDVDIRNAINEGRIEGPRYQGVGARHRLGRHDAGVGRRQSADQLRGALGRGRARGGARANPARHRLDQAVSGRGLLVQPDRRGPIRGDLSDAGAAGPDR